MKLPIRARLVILHVSLLAVILASLFTFLVVRLRSDLVAGLDDSLAVRAAQISLGLQGSKEGEFRDVSSASLRGLPLGESAAQLLDVRGDVLEASGEAAATRALVGADVVRRAFAGERIRITVPVGPEHEPFRVLVVRVDRSSRRDAVVVGTSLEGIDQSVHRLEILLLVAGPAALLVAGAGGWVLARRALLPVARMTNKAAAIGADRPQERIDVPATSDEVQQLAVTLNGMLDRLHHAVDEQRRFLDDASHELRTPLAAMRAEIDVALRSTDLSAEARETLESSREEAERMTRLVDRLLTLARLDELALSPVREPVELREIAERVRASLQRIAEPRGVSIDVDGRRTRILGDPAQLEEALSNLVDNAVKHSRRGQSVRISVWSEGGRTGFTVIDRGTGIPAEALDRLFERFYRVDPSRSRDEGGSGLGLGICRAVAEAHGGSVTVRSEPGRGSEFTVSLPER
jgi:heavy metal sensor kinase